MGWFVFIFIVALIALIADGFFIVRQQTTAVVERFGKFKRIARITCSCL